MTIWTSPEARNAPAPETSPSLLFLLILAAMFAAEAALRIGVGQ